MTLSEVLISALLLALAGSQSLGVWARTLTWSERQQQRAELLLKLDGELQLLQVRLRRAGSLEPPSGDCLEALDRMERLLAPSRLAQVPGLERQLVRLGGGIQIRYHSEPLAVERQRWWSPLAFGFCPPVIAALP